MKALDEIAFWLERDLAPSFKVQAFRRAADSLRSMTEQELAAQLEDGRLKRRKGIGDSSLGIISQALEGDVPDRLVRLRRDNATPLAADAEPLLSALAGDLHTHTDWSDGGSSPARMILTAGELGRGYIAITDHSPSLRVANGLSAERLTQQLTLLDELDQLDQFDELDGSLPTTTRPTVLRGIEVDILEDHTLDQTDEMLDRLDVVVASVHSKLRSDSTVMTRRMLSAIRNPHTNVLGHCTGRLVRGSRGTRPPSQFDAAKVFAECARHDVAVEINARPEREDPPDDLIEQALEAGCLFSLDSDAHAPGQLDFLSYAAARAQRAGVPAERIVTTWPLDRLREWLAS